MNNQAKIGIAIALGAVAGVAIGIIAPRQMGAWVGMGIAIGTAVGLAITRGKIK